jgi:NAD(P)-dependent dehydrogenase (short-subunit alcohol dehydrogenase family)
MNLNDSIHAFDRDQHLALYEANCLSIALSLSMLLNEGHLAKPARLCVISSIWQNITRQNKFSYSVTKAALKGLVLSAAADLAREGHLINAVLPGVLETPMTRANLSEAQIRSFEHATLFGSLAGLEEVAYAVWSLVSPRNGGITGQFIKVDRGYSDVRII